MKVHFSNIEWDTDGEQVDLPSEASLEDIAAVEDRFRLIEETDPQVVVRAIKEEK